MQSTKQGSWTTVLLIEEDFAAQYGLIDMVETQRSAVEMGLLQRVPQDQEVAGNPRLMPTRKLVDGIVARVNGDSTYRLDPAPQV